MCLGWPMLHNLDIAKGNKNENTTVYRGTEVWYSTNELGQKEKKDWIVTHDWRNK